MVAQEADQELEAGEDEDGGEGARLKRKRLPGKKLVLYGALPLLLILAGAGGAWYMGLLNPYLPGQQAEGGSSPPPKPRPAVFYDLPDLLVNLSTNGRKSHYLKISISLELENASDVQQVEAVLPRIIDNFQVYLRELRVEDLRGSAGLTRLREQLLARINLAAAPARVSDVLFREMLVQ